MEFIIMLKLDMKFYSLGKLMELGMQSVGS